MKPTDRADFCLVLCSTAELYNRSLTDAALELWWSALKDLSLDSVKTGISKHLRDPEQGKFMPMPAHIRKQIGVFRKDPVIAWSLVEQTMSARGRYRTVQFEDGTINAVIRDMGGWPWLCNQNLDEPWTQKEFERRYQVYRDQNIELCEPLVGLHELDNRQRGYLDYIDPVILITDGRIQNLIESGEDDDEQIQGRLANVED